MFFDGRNVRLTKRKNQFSARLIIEKHQSSKSTALELVNGTLKISTLENRFEFFDIGSSPHHFY